MKTNGRAYTLRSIQLVRMVDGLKKEHFFSLYVGTKYKQIEDEVWVETADSRTSTLTTLSVFMSRQSKIHISKYCFTSMQHISLVFQGLHIQASSRV